MEARVLNRWLRPQSYNGGIGIYLGEGTFDGSTFYSRDRNVGLAVFSDSQTFDGVDFSEGVVRFARFGASKPLTGRQVDSWSLRLVPLSGIGGCLGASSEAAASVEEGTLKIQVSEQRLGNKLLMLTEDSQTLEAIVDLYPEHVLEIPLGGLKPIEFVLRDPGKNEILRVSGNPTTYEPRPAIITDVVPKRRREDGAHLSTSTSVEDLMRATFEVSQRHLAFTILGLKALATQRHADAEAAFEQALNYNAEDPLLWWGKAVAARLDGKENEAEVLNAHYLAPLEPALRAESYLAQPISLDPEPNRLLAPLEENPEEFIEVACLLIEAGMHDQASRWLDEAIRHRDLPMLRYLMAYCLVVKTRLNAEASEQVRVAGKTPLVPPFPFRDLERTAILTLSETFPSDQRLAVLAGYVNTLDL